MARVERVDVGNHVYHVLNRANARVQIFDNKNDYKQFETILEKAKEHTAMRILAYCIMPNHWHLVLYPYKDGDLQVFMSWLTNTHTRRWHVAKDTVGQGHLYQGRYKSFICQEDEHFLTLVRYVERNAKKANLVKRAENWQWSSVWRREHGTLEQKKLLSEWPVSIPHNYLAWLNQPQTQSEEDALERSMEKSVPFGEKSWIRATVKKFRIEQVLRNVGRPQKGEKGG
jgi:putative transposase